MQVCQCSVLVSVLETYGVANLEPVAMGLPVISTRSGGPEDFINDENRFLIEKADITTVTRGLTYVRNNIKIFSLSKSRLYISNP